MKKPEPTKIEKYIKKVKGDKISKTIKKGKNQVTITNALNATETEIQKAKEQLLKPLIDDEQILQIMTQEENLQKMKHRFITTIHIKGKDGKEQIIAKKANATPKEIIKETKQTLRTGMDIEAGSGEIVQLLKQKMKIGRENIKNVATENDTLTTVNLTITFTKGR